MTPSASPESQAEVAVRILGRGLFRHTNREHPAMAALVELGMARRAELVAKSDPIIARELRFVQGMLGAKPPMRPMTVIDPDTVALPEMELPSPPQVFTELQQALADDRCGAAELADIIGKDTALTAKLLKLVNSPYYGLMVKVDTLPRALTIVGTQELVTISSSIATMSAFKDIPPEAVDMEAFWRHSLGAACMARGIARKAGLPEPDRYFVAGLLHDLGRLVLYKNEPDVMLKALEDARARGELLYHLEQDVLGFDHATMGSVILRKWSIPKDLRLAVLGHHSPEFSGNPDQNTVVHLADIMARALAIGVSGEYFVQPLSEEGWEALGLAPEDLAPIAKDCLGQLEPLFETLLVSA